MLFKRKRRPVNERINREKPLFDDIFNFFEVFYLISAKNNCFDWFARAAFKELYQRLTYWETSKQRRSEMTKKINQVTWQTIRSYISLSARWSTMSIPISASIATNQNAHTSLWSIRGTWYLFAVVTNNIALDVLQTQLQGIFIKIEWSFSKCTLC